MATKNIVPRADGEGSIGTTLKRWLSGFFNWLNIKQYIKLEKYTPSHEEGRVFYDHIHHTLSYYNEISDVEVNLALESLVRVKNMSGSNARLTSTSEISL
jgi:hypothetical protein